MNVEKKQFLWTNHVIKLQFCISTFAFPYKSNEYSRRQTICSKSNNRSVTTDSKFAGTEDRREKNCKPEVSEACKLNVDVIIKMQNKIVTKPVELRDLLDQLLLDRRKSTRKQKLKYQKNRSGFQLKIHYATKGRTTRRMKLTTGQQVNCDNI